MEETPGSYAHAKFWLSLQPSTLTHILLLSHISLHAGSLSPLHLSAWSSLSLSPILHAWDSLSLSVKACLGKGRGIWEREMGIIVAACAVLLERAT